MGDHRHTRRIAIPNHPYILSFSAISAASLFCLVTFSMLMPIMSGGGEQGGGNVVRQAIYILIIGAGLVGAQAQANLGKLVAIPFTMMLAVAWCWASILWAIDPGTAIRRLILTTMMFLGVFITVNELGYSASFRMVFRSLLILTVISFVIAIVIPSIGVHLENEFDNSDLVGNWKGIFGHKNYAGPVSAILILMLCFQPVRLQNWLRYGALLGAAFFLYKTSSKTSIALTVIAIATGQIFMFYNPRHRNLAVPLFLTFCVVAPLAVWWNWDALAAPFQSEDSFTGRVQIWPAMLAFHQDNWWGAGYGSFWNIQMENPIISYVPFKSFVEIISSGHNGYIDMLVTIGPIGVLFAVIALIIAPISRLLSANIPRRQAGLTLAVIVFAAGHNMTETSFMDRDQPVHILLIAFIAMLGAAVVASNRERGLRRNYPARHDALQAEFEAQS